MWSINYSELGISKSSFFKYKYCDGGGGGIKLFCLFVFFNWRLHIWIYFLNLTSQPLSLLPSIKIPLIIHKNCLNNGHKYFPNVSLCPHLTIMPVHEAKVISFFNINLFISVFYFIGGLQYLFLYFKMWLR